MRGDRLYQDIIDALDGDIDADQFELAATDLLAPEHPGLFSMSGGTDGGYDAALPDGESGLPAPLLATISRSGPLANYRKNIQTYMSLHPEGPRRAVIATPRKVTAKQKDNLMKVASQEHGVTVTAIYSREDFARLLYRHPAWRKSLLQVTGAPPALSRFPLQGRAERPARIGREEDLAWLRARLDADGPGGDAVLAGQPGLGKTYLQEALVEEGLGLFVVRDDATEIADDLRRDPPRVVIVDDAANQFNLLDTLKAVRQDAIADFSIHANCWPSQEGQVRERLGLPREASRTLHPLSRDEMAAVFKSLNIGGPERLLGLLLEQAEGKPGLAAAFMPALRANDAEAIWSGEAVAQSLLDRHPSLTGTRARHVLACFALAGDAGATNAEVAEHLKLSVLEVADHITALAAGGVVEEVAGGNGEVRVVVRPPGLRGWLVREAFFRGAARIPHEPLVEALWQAIGGEPICDVLLQAAVRGAAVGVDQLLSLVRCSSEHRRHPLTPRLWQHLAQVDGGADAILQAASPQEFLLAVPGLLEAAPEETLQRLLQNPPPEPAPTGGQQEEPRVAAVDAWLQGDTPGDATCVERRRQTATAAAARLRAAPEGEASWFAVEVLVRALSPRVSAFRTSAINPNAVNINQGILSSEDLQELSELSGSLMQALGHRLKPSAPLRRLIQEWAEVRSQPGRELSPEDDAVMRGTASTLLDALVVQPERGRAVRTWAKSLAQRAHLGLHVPTDRVFHALFGRTEIHEDWERREARQQAALHAMAARIASDPPTTALEGLASMEKEAALVDPQWARQAWQRSHLYTELGRLVADPAEWVLSAASARLPSSAMSNLCWHALPRIQEEKKEEVALEMFADPEYDAIAARWAMANPHASENLVAAACDVIEERLRGRTPDVMLCFQMRLSVAAAARLLRSKAPEVRTAVAVAETLSHPEDGIRPGLQELWEPAILSSPNLDESHLFKILERDVPLRIKWLRRWLNKEENTGAALQQTGFDRDRIPALCQSLPLPVRRELLQGLPWQRAETETLIALMGTDAVLMKLWLKRCQSDPELEKHGRLAPLQREMDERWVAFASHALDAGATEREVAKRYFARGGSWSGSESVMHRKRLGHLEVFREHPDARIRRVIDRCREVVMESLTRCEREDRRVAIRGR